MSAVAAVIAGGLSAGVYTTNSIPDLQSVVKYAGSPSSLEVKSWQGLLDIGREENS